MHCRTQLFIFSPCQTDGHRRNGIVQFNPGGLAAWFAGAFVGLALNNASGFLASLSAPATFVISWMGYSALLAGAKRTWFVRNTLADR
jgi:hypothetical protein